MDELKPGDRVEVVESQGGYAAGQQGTVSRVEDGFIMVKLDKRSRSLGGVTVIDFSGAEAQIASVFYAASLRRVVTLSA